jgi:signal transduction histidine kinase
VAIQCTGQFDDLSEEARLTLFQIARELLANVAKHAQARNVDVMLHREKDAVSVVVRDDGVGFDAAAGQGRASDSFGLFSIRERLRHQAGTLHVLTEPGGGTQVTAFLPLVNRQRAGAAGAAR